MKVVVFKPGEAPVVTEIESGLKALQAVVDGYIEPVRTPIPGVVFLVNEEGLLRGLPSNRFGLVGTFCAVAVKGENFASLTEKQIKTLLNLPYHERNRITFGS